MLFCSQLILQLFTTDSKQQDDSKNRDNVNNAHSNGFSVVVIRFDFFCEIVHLNVELILSIINLQ